MKNHKQMLADFYLQLLSIQPTNRFRALNQALYANIVWCLATELGEDVEVVQRIFERMAAEDVKNI